MVECPICHTTNPPGTLACLKCSTPIEINIATIVASPENATVMDPALDPEATQAVVGGTTGWSVPVQKPGAASGSAPIQPGSVLGERYEILKRLGEGGMGAVYKVRDRELERLVALKIIRPELAGNPEILRRFKQELILARQVTHKNVIRIFDLGMADGRKFITMDYVEGRDLKSVLVERGKLPPEEAVPIVQQVCRGLEAAHTEGVVHRDLKPQNIMVDADGRVWVMDFGLARSMETAGITRTGALMGTPDYMSPEQARGEKVDARSDLFSLGIIFYEMLTGRLPFQADTLMATLLKRVQEKAVQPTVLEPAIPPYINRVVMKCLESDVAKRYQSTGEILTDLSDGTQQTVTSTSAQSDISLGAIGPGTQFGPRYRIESVIGEGGMGKVYKAYDNDLDRTVALKVVRNELASDPNSMLRLKQELLLASRISHRNILRIHDLGDVAGMKFISMAYVDGRDLHDLLTESGRLPVERVVNIAKQLAAALDAAHSEGVIHRDLKPRNVLIDAADHVYISDFGLAKLLEGDTATQMTRVGEILGTPLYMSPEQAEAKPADHRSDIYSYGVIVYEMATGQAPFGGDSTMQVMYQHVTQAPKDPKLVNPEVPDYLAAVILKCLQKDPIKRYPQAREILHDLESATAPKRVVRLRIAETGYPKWLIAAIVAIPVLLAASLLISPIRDVVLGRSSISISKRGGASSANDKYLAILPLRVMGQDEALKYEAEGIVDALTAKLFQLKNVHLATPSAVEKMSPTAPVDKIARELGVKLVVQGAMQGAGDKIDIVLNLTDASGRRLWSKDFPGMRQDLLTIESDVYNSLVDQLGLKPSSEELTRSTLPPTDNMGAYELYLKGRSIMRGKRDTKRVKSALDLFEQATKKDSSFALAYAGIADACLDMYGHEKDTSWSQKAQAAALHAQALNDDLPEIHFALGNVYLTTGKTNEAVAELKRALELAPNSDEGYRRLGDAYLAAKKPDDALQAYQRAVEVNPYFWLNFNHLGGAYVELGKYDKALEAFRSVVNLMPDYPTGYENLGVTYYQMGKWNDCVPALEKALQLQPSASIYSNLGTAYFYLGRHADAVKMFEKAVAMNPNEHTAAGNLADGYRWSGQPEQARKTYQRAIELAQKALRVNPADASTMGTLGSYYAKNGNTREGLDYIRRARNMQPDDIQLIYQNAVVNLIVGEQAEALKNLREAFQKGYPLEEAKVDPELKTLQSAPEFGKLLAEFSQKRN